MLYDYDKLAEIRHQLHQLAELSGREENTAAYIVTRLSEFKPDRIVEKLSGNGILAIFETGKPGPAICFRADIDALPIADSEQLSYRSQNQGTSHKCGHDGHSTILLGLADWIRDNISSLQGSISLLFQPAEETAQGAKAVLADARFTDIKPDFIFGLHNLPGFPTGSVIVRDGIFAGASCGIKIGLLGKTSHAGHPENGISPLPALLKIVKELIALPETIPEKDAATMVTIIHLKLGEEAFGTSPGTAEIMATFRSYDNDILFLMLQQAEQLVSDIAASQSLKFSLQRVEKFASTVNDAQANHMVRSAARKLGCKIIEPEQPFRWTEDFSFYTQKYKSAFMGLGAGLSHPQLHNPDYDFPDELISHGIKLFSNIILEVAKSNAVNKLD